MQNLQAVPVTMSSREIAELTGKEHKNVLRDIREMLDALEKDGSDLSHVRDEKDARGYTKQFHLDRELTETLVTGYSIPLRHKVIKRLHQLEENQQTGLPSAPDVKLQAIEAAMRIVLSVPGVDPSIASANALTMIANETGIDVEPMRLALPSREVPTASLNATEVGKRIGKSAKTTNCILELLGLQARNARNEWELTEAGREYGEAIPFGRHGHSGYQVRWTEKLVEMLVPIADELQ